MNEEKTYEKVKGEMRLSERILAELPGFRGYKEKEIRRESDKMIRNHLYRKLNQAKEDLRRVFQKLSDYRRYEFLTDMDRLMARIDRIAEKINHASYGYTGFFDAVKVEEPDLDRMIKFDAELLDDVEEIVKASSAFKADIEASKFDAAKKHIEKVGGLIETLEKTFDERREAILGVK
ncbi:hypothetical protein DRO19_04030 [Candidatus Bathyarchaeota archaeon]|nr:MAG: hypothetical protein DRO19_04030 [Candidatus Bathyarchaeota archaeon]